VRNGQWYKILSEVNSIGNLNSDQIIEEIRSILAAVLPQYEYQKWKNKKDVDHVFQVKYIEDLEGLEDINHQTLLHIAAGFGLKNVVNALLAKGADINAIDKYGKTPLHYAQNAGVVKALVAKDADVKVVDIFGNTPLHYAAEKGCIDVVNALLSAGAKINAVNRHRRTPLHLAAQAYCMDLVNVLLKQNANPCLKDNDGKTPRSLAENHKMWPFVGSYEKQRWKDAEKKVEEKMRQYLKSVMITSVTVGCSTAAFEMGLAALLITTGDLSVEPIPMILTAMAIALVSLAVGYIVYQALKEPGTKINKTQHNTTQHNTTQPPVIDAQENLNLLH